jgi:Tol biopolymer transport system component
MIGETIAHYQVTAKLGEGGMGEVYRATDTKLHRDVAIKVLPESFAKDVDRMARFTREAQVLASLNHPNIAAIHGIEDRALIMELVEGETLKGPLPLDTALDYARQIADALEAAHEKGIVHRDLKPANIKVTPQGVVKILDFGLAKAAEEPAGNAENSPTLTISPTRAGLILGTAAYMSPEQARGKPVDKRADIWAFGVVLYEMLTGQRLFPGEMISDTLAAVLKEEPDLERVSSRVRRLLRGCLEKDPKKRLQAILDWRLLLEDGPVVAPSRSRLGIGASIVAGVLFVALGILSFLYFRERPPLKTVVRATITLPGGTPNLHSFAISPDGRLVAIVALVNGKQQLWLRALDALQAQPMPGTDDATYPFWSPDSHSIGFFAQGKLKKIAASGGPPQSLCDALVGAGGSWSRENVIVFSPLLSNAIQRVSAAGGVPADVTKPKGRSEFPVFLPDGRHFLYTVLGGSVEDTGVYLSSLDGKENRPVLLADVSSVVFGAGRLLFIRDDTLVAQTFDVASGQAVGEVFPVAGGVSARVLSYAPVTVSETGVLLYESGVAADNQMAWYDRGGKRLGTVDAPGQVFDPAISPDGKAIAFRRRTASGSDLWLWDLSRGAEQRFTTDASFNSAPFWSPNGDRIVFASSRGGGIFDLYQKATNGTGKDELLRTSGKGRLPTQWSRDGRFIVYSEGDPKAKWDIGVLRMDSVTNRKPVPFLRSEFNELHGQLSPDSQWMAYTSDKTGQREVYVVAFPTGEGETRISIVGGEQPRWRGDGKELFFVGAGGKMTAVALKATAGTKLSLEPGAPQPLFEAHLAQTYNNLLFEYDVTSDGKRFLLDTTGGSASALPLNVVVNWDAAKK